MIETMAIKATAMVRRVDLDDGAKIHEAVTMLATTAATAQGPNQLLPTFQATIPASGTCNHNNGTMHLLTLSRSVFKSSAISCLSFMDAGSRNRQTVDSEQARHRCAEFVRQRHRVRQRQ